MINKKYFFILTLFIVCMFAISAISAAEAASDINCADDNEGIILDESQEQLELNNANDNEISDESPNEKLSSTEDNLLSEEGNFKELNELINGNNNTEITLDKNYTFMSGDMEKDGITIKRSLTIDGNGFTINGNGNGRIFYVSNGTVLFKNINFINGDIGSGPGGAICTDTASEVTAIGCNFTNNLGYYGGAAHGITAINCRFEENHYPASGAGAALHDSIAINCYFKHNWIMEAIYPYPDTYEVIYPLCSSISVNCTYDDTKVRLSGNRFFERLYFEIENYTSQMGSGIGVYIKFCGINGNEEIEEIKDVKSFIHIYQDGNEIDTVKVASGSRWIVKLPV